MKIKDYISYMFVAGVAMLASCSQEAVIPDTPEENQTVGVGQPFTLTGSITVPEMETASTRTLGETPGRNLKLTILEFDKGADATSSFLENIYQATIIDATTAVANGVEVKFQVTLNATNRPRTLHFMLANDYVSCNYGSEAAVIPTIYSTDEAYWNKVELDNGYVENLGADGTGTLSDEAKAKLTNIPMIRNFAKISIENKATDVFELYGFELVSIPRSGTIAPYNETTQSVPQLLNADNQMLTYSAAHNVYPGIMPANVTFANSEAEVKAMNNFTHTNTTANVLWSRNARYFFEHPFNSLNYTYMIVQGRYHAPGVQNPTNRIDYYKIDLGVTNPETGMFEFYDLLRNFNFNVVINSVIAPGAATPALAVDGQVYNNISASVETSAMPNVSDGENMLFVNNTSFVFTTTTPETFLYRYMTDVTGSRNPDNSKVFTHDLAVGSVIQSYEESTYTDESGTEWKAIKITPNTPTDITQTQSFTVIDGQGLGRTINLTLHNPWNITNANVYAGHSDERPGTETLNVVSSATGAEFTVYFNLPDDLTAGMFPLQFQLEANPQNMENNPIGTLVVSTGPSLFDESVTAISYIKTVSWKEYNYMYKGDGSNEVNTNRRNTNHLVRCRFRTITAASGTATIKIHNPYFYDQEITITRR